MARLKDFVQIPLGFWGSLKAPRPPAARCATQDACRRTPLWKFLPTGLIIVPYLFLALAIKQPEISKMWKHQIVEIIRPNFAGENLIRTYFPHGSFMQGFYATATFGCT